MHKIDIRIYRPLANISAAELSFYASNIKGWSLPTLSIPATGIDGLVDGELLQGLKLCRTRLIYVSAAFIHKLESGFPSTVSIIGKTAGKLSLRSGNSDAQQLVCPLCQL